MDTSIYSRLGFQFLPHTVNAWVDAPSSQKKMERIYLKFAYYLDEIHFNLLNVLCLQLVGAYIFTRFIN